MASPEPSRAVEAPLRASWLSMASRYGRVAEVAALAAFSVKAAVLGPAAADAAMSSAGGLEHAVVAGLSRVREAWAAASVLSALSLLSVLSGVPGLAGEEKEKKRMGLGAAVSLYARVAREVLGEGASKHRVVAPLRAAGERLLRPRVPAAAEDLMNSATFLAVAKAERAWGELGEAERRMLFAAVRAILEHVASAGRGRAASALNDITEWAYQVYLIGPRPPGAAGPEQPGG